MAAPTQKQIRMMHIVNLMSIAYADGKITEDENNIIVKIAQRWDLTEEDFDACLEHWKNTDENDLPIAIPDSDDEQYEFLKDFTIVMMIDGTIEENEKNYLITVGDRFGFNGEEVVPTMIDIVYKEYFADNEEEEDNSEDEEEEEEDPLFADTYDESQINLGKYELEDKHVAKAFDELFLPALRNVEAYEYFQIIPGIDTRLFLLTDEQIEKVKEVADKGYALGYYVLGRYHQVVKPEEDSLEKAQQLLESAANAGIHDAYGALAQRYLLGYNGPVVMDEYNKLIDQAIDNGSPMALMFRIKDMIYGEHGQKPEPKKVITLIENFLNSDDTNEAKFPYMYDLMGEAYRKAGNKAKADECYEKAVDHGYFEAGAHRFECKVEGPDRDFYRETLSVLLDFACDENDPRAFLISGLEDVYHYDTQGEAKHESNAQKIREHLETAFNLGEGDAAYYLGLYHYKGQYGFEQSNQEAWNWFSKGQDRESGLAFAGMAMMIKDGVKPNGLPDNYLEYCQLSALRRGVKEMAPAIVQAYKDGKIDALAEEVEKTYIPMLTQVADQSGIPTIVIVNPEGKAVIYKVEKEEWNKLPSILGAQRLAPVRVDALEKLGKKAGLTDRLVAWIDIDAPRKGLPVNAIANKFYDGIIAGEVVFSFADKLFEQVPFYGVDEAKAVVKALGAELKEVVTDLRAISETKRTHADYSKINPTVNLGYVARIEPDGSAHIVKVGLDVFALFEEDIYDPARLKPLYDLGEKLGLKGRLTIWTDNSALRKQMVMDEKITQNPIAAKWYPGPAADNIFVAMEDEQCHIMLFDEVEPLKQAVIAMGVEPGKVMVGSSN